MPANKMAAISRPEELVQVEDANTRAAIDDRYTPTRVAKRLPFVPDIGEEGHGSNRGGLFA